jgi:hypothetical protein
MLDFELPFLSGSNSIRTALAETIEADKSGLLYETSSGELRLARYDDIVKALNSGITILEDLGEASSEPVIHVGTVSSEHYYERRVRAKNKKFGFKGFEHGVARLFSVSERYGEQYISSNSGTRCKRPDKPANILPRDWYHYYPPQTPYTPPPNICNVCGSPI